MAASANMYKDEVCIVTDPTAILRPRSVKVLFLSRACSLSGFRYQHVNETSKQEKLLECFGQQEYRWCIHKFELHEVVNPHDKQLENHAGECGLSPTNEVKVNKPR